MTAAGLHINSISDVGVGGRQRERLLRLIDVVNEIFV